jgi:hypothetical protein
MDHETRQRLTGVAAGVPGPWLWQALWRVWLMEYGVSPGSSFRVHCGRRDEIRSPIGRHDDGPFTTMDNPVMMGAQECQVPNVGGAACEPENHVVAVAVFRFSGAVRESATAVA